MQAARQRRSAGWPVTCSLPWLVAIVMVVGCARSPGVGGLAVDPGAEGMVGSRRILQTAGVPAEPGDAEDYDPWQPFNERVFAFNHGVLDRWLIKPVATGWEKVMPAAARRSFARAFDNLDLPRRLVNNLLQARPLGAGRELARFAVNTTVGVAGLFDVATVLDIESSDADAGQTLALYGIGPGPYLVLPTFPPLTVRDAIGRGIDGLLDPVGYVLPFVANRAKSIVTGVNERSLKLQLYADVEESVLDLYSAARNAYLQRRRAVVRRALASRGQEWQWAFQTEPTTTAQRPAAPVSGSRDPA